LEHVAAKNGCTILIANQESLSPQEEMVQDLLWIVHTFSCRLYGLRRYEKALKDELGGGAGDGHPDCVLGEPERREVRPA
jgi:predicted site-specific integrase-resolvase